MALDHAVDVTGIHFHAALVDLLAFAPAVLGLRTLAHRDTLTGLLNRRALLANLETRLAAGTPTSLRLSLADNHDGMAGVGFPYFGGIETPNFNHNASGDGAKDVLVRTVPVQRI